MRFGSVHYLWLLLCIPLLVGFFIWSYQRRQAALRSFASPALIKRLSESARLSRLITRWVMFLAFAFFLIFALARPRFGVKSEMVERKGVDIIIALDISQSMLAEDVTPGRLERAKFEIGRFLDLLKGDRIGVVVFSGEAFVQCPLTLDYGAAKMFLNAVDPSWIQMPGTVFAEAIRVATDAFHSKARKYKVLIIISDGEDHQGEALEAAKKAAEEGIKIYTVGIGSQSGVPIPLSKGGGNVVYKKDREGNLVMTRLNSLLLEKIALEGNGAYFHAGTTLDLAQIYGEISKMEKKQFGLNKMTVYEERYQIFLFMALLFLLVEFFIPERVKKRAEWKGRFEA
jgi:Ca-activated chloride channel family protein